MAAPVDYIPPREADFVGWLTNFNTLVLANYASYGLTLSQATNLNSLTTIYLSAYATATAPSTRTSETIAAKDSARSNVTTYARGLASQIQQTPGVTNDQKDALGLTIRKTAPTPIPAPTTSPLLSFIAATPLQHTLRASDQLTPDSRKKPFGVLLLRLSVWYTAQGVLPTGNPDQVQMYTKQPMAVMFPSAQVGKAANYIGNWQTRTGLLGPNSAPLVAGIV